MTTTTADRVTAEEPTEFERRLDEPITADRASQPQSRELAERIDYARTLATSDLLPKSFQKKPGNVLWAIAYGEAIGIADVVAMQSVHVIEGKPGASADLMVALARRAGHKVRSGTDVDEKGEPTAWAHLIRSDDPEFLFEVVWTMDDARRAKLAGKDNWVKDPRSMLLARCKSGVVRQGASEVLMGVIYTPDEVEDIVAAERAGEPIKVPNLPGGSIREAAEAAAAARAALSGQAPAESKPVEDIVDGEVVEDEPLDGEGTRQLKIALVNAGYRTAAQQRTKIAEVLGKGYDPATLLTTGQAEQVMIDLGESAPAGDGEAASDPVAEPDTITRQGLIDDIAEAAHAAKVTLEQVESRARAMGAADVDGLGLDGLATLLADLRSDAEAKP